jgi:hypothetical protein
VYYLSHPDSFSSFVSDPFHMLVYVSFTLGTCALFSRLWIDVSGSGPKEVFKQLRDQGIAYAGRRDVIIIIIIITIIITLLLLLLMPFPFSCCKPLFLVILKKIIRLRYFVEVIISYFNLNKFF